MSSKSYQGGGGRIAYLDALKCFAILLVIEGHVRGFGMGIKSYDTLPAQMFYTFDLPIFFFISGFLAFKPQLQRKDIISTLKKKAVYLIVPAVIFSLASSLINHKEILAPLTHGFGKYWFTITLFECFLLYYVSLILISKRAIVNICLIVFSLLGILLLSIKLNIGLRILDLPHLFKYFYFFTIGIFARQWQPFYNKIISNEYFKAVVIIGYFILLFLLNYQIWPNALFHFFRDIVLRLLGTAAVVMVFAVSSSVWEKNNKFTQVVTSIGRKSLAIYMLQYFFIPDFKSFSQLMAMMDTYTIHIISAIYTVLITTTCFAFIYVLEQSKFLKTYVLGMR